MQTSWFSSKHSLAWSLGNGKTPTRKSSVDIMQVPPFKIVEFDQVIQV